MTPWLHSSLPLCAQAADGWVQWAGFAAAATYPVGWVGSTHLRGCRRGLLPGNFLYKNVHSLHHKSYNPTAFSGAHTWRDRHTWLLLGAPINRHKHASGRVDRLLQRLRHSCLLWATPPPPLRFRRTSSCTGCIAPHVVLHWLHSAARCLALVALRRTSSCTGCIASRVVLHWLRSAESRLRRNAAVTRRSPSAA
jgi:hypothetical protein